MIKVLGAQRVLVLVFLVAINAALAAGLYLYVQPEKIKKERELRSKRGQVSTTQRDITNMQMEFEQLQAQLSEFEDLKKRGFFNNQERRQAEQILRSIQEESDVITATASVQPGVIERNERATKASYNILMSPINVDIAALDDVDVYKYIYLVEQFFPGHVSFSKIQIERTGKISGPTLRTVADGNNPELVKARLEMQWRTMIPQTDVINVRGQ